MALTQQNFPNSNLHELSLYESTNSKAEPQFPGVSGDVCIRQLKKFSPDGEDFGRPFLPFGWVIGAY